MEELDLQKLDRDIARAARAERAWRRLLREDAARAARQAWYEPVRYVTTRSTFATVSDLGSDHPLCRPFQRWVHRLALTRIGADYWVEVARVRQAPSIEIASPERGTFSPRDIVRRALFDGEPARVRAWLEGLHGQAAPILSAEKRAREAYFEITSRLGVEDPRSLVGYDRDCLRREAARFLSDTAELATATCGAHQDWAGLLPVLVARHVPGVWPARVDGRWMVDLFRTTPFLQGISLDLGTPPSPLGASSFARGLARLGASYARAAAGGAWFVQSRDPSELASLRRGALFGSLLLDPVFLRQKIGLSRDAARDAARALTTTVLASLRLAAAQSILDFALASPRQIEEATSEALRVRVAEGFSGALPRPDACAPERWLAALLANDERAFLRDRFDEDWFANPEALLHLRETDAAAPAEQVGNEKMEGSAGRLARAFDDLAGG